jgi:hypothetical protein
MLDAMIRSPKTRAGYGGRNWPSRQDAKPTYTIQDTKKMAKAIYICTRYAQSLNLRETEVSLLARRLTPDHIAPKVRNITTPDGINAVIIGDNDSIMVHGVSLLLGAAESDQSHWWQPETDVPDGTYALFRADSNRVELVTDTVASRSIWYVHTNDLFIASTSQRAIITVLRSFKPDQAVYPWVLSSGSLGPGLSWDQRIKSMRGDSRFTLDRNTWCLREHVNEVVFSTTEVSDREHEALLNETLERTFQNINLDYSKWVLALSGGYDSRASLKFLLKNHCRPKCITWGKSDSQDEPGTDAHVATQLTTNYGLDHELFSTELTNEPLEHIFDRVLMASEGRIDHLDAALDGFERYKRMCESNICGLIRSDEGFGWVPVSDELTVRRSVDLTMLCDYSNGTCLGANELFPQLLPEHLKRMVGETLETWRDRLYHEFRIPYILAGLAEGRLCYMEQSNPLLSRRILYAVRHQPDHLRTQKALFRRIIAQLEPDIPIATKSGISSWLSVLSRSEIREFINDEIRTERAKSLLPISILQYCYRHLESDAFVRGSLDHVGLMPLVKKCIPSSLKRTAKTIARRLRKKEPVGRLSIDALRVVIRCFIISRMHRILSEDSCLLS